MTVENGPKQVENFIGDMPFGITVEIINKCIEETRSELAEIQAELPNESNEKLKQHMNSRKLEGEKILEVPPDEILRLLQEIYDFVHQKEAQRLSLNDILQDMKTSKPELAESIMKFYRILRTQTWGYRLGQRLSAMNASRT